MTITLKYLSVLALLSLGACKEDFPPYEEPQNVLMGSLATSAPDTIEGAADPNTGQYYLNTPIILNVLMKNTYDNLLQGTALVKGRLVIQTFSAVPRTCVVTLSTGDLRRPPVFQGNIAIAPDSTALFSLIWVPIGTDNKYVFEGVPYTLIGNTRFYAPITFLAQAEVQLFERVQAIRFGNLEFKVVFKISEG
jgi:hypothetical protein